MVANKRQHKAIRRLGLAVAVILLCGCDETGRIQVQDQTSKAPVADVVVKWTQLRYPTLMNPKIETGQLPSTDEEGWVELKGLRIRAGSHNLEFSRAGYATTYVIFAPHVNKIEIRVQGQQANDSQAITNVVTWTNVLIIPLVRL
jgi:hypothetical protein